ncbi:MAG: hypothetical protein ACJAWO_002542 [Halieaceae bacterium]
MKLSCFLVSHGTDQFKAAHSKSGLIKTIIPTTIEGIKNTHPIILKEEGNRKTVFIVTRFKRAQM